MKRIAVALGLRSHSILIEPGLVERCAELLEPLARGGRLAVVTDATVWEAQGARLAKGLGSLSVDPIILPPGEATKSWSHLSGLVERLLALGLGRNDHVMAFGGGVIGDLAGFAAAILKRGCHLVQVPTTLLAQVDSSIGGKTGINSPSGKNLVGAFHQPAMVLIDPICLATLPARQLRAGYGETVKYGLIGDPGFFAWCESNGPTLLAGDLAAQDRAIATSVAAKVAIVQADEHETSGDRMLLNLGHTFAHALETETGFSDRLLHGEAVAIGMTLAYRFSAQRGLCDTGDAERVATHLAAVGLPTRLADAGMEGSGERLVAHMVHDKKARGGRVPLILARGIGRAFVDNSVALDEIAEFLAGAHA